MRGFDRSSAKCVLLLGWACLAGPGQADESASAGAPILPVPVGQAAHLSPRSGEATPTKLRLELLGTSVSPDKQLSWAAITTRDREDHELVTLGSEISPGVVVVGIERLRLLLDHDGRLEELVTAEGLRPPDPSAKAPPMAAVPADSPQRLPQTESERRQALLQRIARNPAALYSQARIRPRYEAGKMVGLELSDFTEGSTFEGIGLADGDLVIEFDGTAVTSAPKASRFLQSVKTGELSEIRVLGVDGDERTLTLAPAAADAETGPQ